MWFPTARPDPGQAPGLAATTTTAVTAAGVAVDDIGAFDLYSCFPCAVAMAADALGLAYDDPRGLTATGGLPYFGGPGNNYTTHGIAAVTDRLRNSDGAAPRLGLVTGLGWFVTKHALGLYGSAPPPGGFRPGDTDHDQRIIDASGVNVAEEVTDPTTATVVAATVVRDHDGSATGAPLIARLPDGRHVAAGPVDDEVTAAMGELDIPGVVGTDVVIEGGPPRYRLPHR